MSIDLSKADSYRELRLFAAPDKLHDVIDSLLDAGAWSVKIEPLYEAKFDEGADLVTDEVTEYMLSARFPADEERIDASYQTGD